MTVALAATLLLALIPTTVLAVQSCALAPAFEPLRDAVGVESMGECSSDAVEVAGELTQQTTRGVLVRRAVDGVATFTDETTTWLDGPEGIESRAKNDRLSWEPPVETPLVGQPVPPSIPAIPAIPQVQEPATKLTPALSARCGEIVGSTPNRGGPTIPQQVGICEKLGEEHGAAGVDCYAQATRETARHIGRISTETHNALFDATLQLCKASIR